MPSSEAFGIDYYDTEYWTQSWLWFNLAVPMFHFKFFLKCNLYTCYKIVILDIMILQDYANAGELEYFKISAVDMKTF